MRRKFKIIFISLLIRPIYRLIMRRSKVTVRKPKVTMIRPNFRNGIQFRF